MKLKQLLLILAGFVVSHNYSCEALRIIGIFPLPGKSHFIPNFEILKGLAKRGHQVDVVSHFPLKNPLPNYTDIPIIESTIPAPTNNVTYDVAKKLEQMSLSYLVKIAGIDLCDFLSHKVFQELLKPPKIKYDIVIVELFTAHCYIAFGQHFKAPVVATLVSKMQDWLHGPFGVPTNTAYMPVLFSSYSQDMTYFERLKNTLLSLIVVTQINYYMDAEREHVEKYFGRKLSSMNELYNDVALLLVSSHHSINEIIPTPPGVVEVGGLHVHNDEQQLSPEIQKWLDDSTHGCVYFSFGSMLRIETFPPEILNAFYEMFTRIQPVRVLVKIADAKVIPPGLPMNVKTSPWLPQIAVLKHENIKLFITHGGLMGTQEAIAHAVPMVGIPIFGDQQTNVLTYERKKIAVALELKDINAETLTNAVKTVLNDPIYRNNIKRISELFNDRPMSPLDTAIYWVEYVARYGNILQSPATKLTFWQYYLIDVYGFILLSIIIILYVVKQLFKQFYKCICQRKVGQANLLATKKSKKKQITQFNKLK